MGRSKSVGIRTDFGFTESRSETSDSSIFFESKRQISTLIIPNRKSDAKTPHGVFRSETAAAQAHQKRNGYKFITGGCDGHSPTAQLSVWAHNNGFARPWPLAKGNGFILKMIY
jgi:hypothetical protein